MRIKCVRVKVTRQGNTNGNHTYTNPYYTYDDQSCSNDSSANSTDEKMDMSNIGNKAKRKMATNIIPSSNIRRMFRFRDGNETKYLCREEFVSEEAWNKFLRLMLLNRQRLEGRNQRLSVRKKILDAEHHDLGDQNDDYKDEDPYDPEKFLEVILKE
ncbi:uncharacterized protein [Epargyreus clarus]|uniref:uncharacterized protein isoform X2 n=1 Tax=Epargyreus clarus TaxID=520877 RepID=UPI003C3023D7